MGLRHGISLRIRNLALLAPLLVGCAEDGGADEARRTHVVEGFDQPESVQYDPRQDLYFVSSMVGPGSVKDGLGYISRFPADGSRPPEIFIESGQPGVTLHAPKGLALQGDTLWVADIDVVRGFHRVTGTPVAEIDLRPYSAMLLNSIATGEDRTLYVTDTGIVMAPEGVHFVDAGKIFSVRGREVRLVGDGEDLGYPNGIRWDSGQNRLVVASFHPFASTVYSIDPRSGALAKLADGGGRSDGIALTRDGTLLFTSWRDSSLHVLSGGTDRRLIRHLWQPADLGMDSIRNRVAIPLVLQGQVEIWELPR